MKMRSVQTAIMAVFITAIFSVLFTPVDAKPRYISGDNYNASQFSAPGLQATFSETIKMLIGSNVDAHTAQPEHGAEPAHF